MKRLARHALLAAFLGAAACASGGDGDPDETHAGHDGHDLPATDGPGFTAADVRFMQAMIGHHAQALTMAVMAPTHDAGGQILRLAQKIDISQRDEIVLMERWLAERGQAVPEDHDRHTMRMPGMVTPEQLAELDAARGGAFDRLFLALMIQHHAGALDMVDSLFASPGSLQDSDIFRFVTDVGTDQRDEIGAMEYLLFTLDTPSGSDSR